MNGLIRKGKIAFRKSSEIAFSRVGIGFEKLDRAVFDPEKAYEPVAALGVKYARIQAGWMRTEREKGVYDFSWIDRIVDNLQSRGVEPWINLCYGNPLYNEVAKQFFGAVGCPPTEGEALTAWLAFVRALVVHMKGRVRKYEIWNEPDIEYSWRKEGKVTGTDGTPDGREYGEFAKATALAIREVYPEAYIIGFALGKPWKLGFVNMAMKTGLGDVVDAVSYHAYKTRTRSRIRCFESFSALVHSYNPNLDIIQGESGIQSEFSQAGALCKMNWTRENQVKCLLRLMVTDLSLGCALVSYFSAMDMVEALNGLLSDKKSYLDYGFFGVISADFDENGVATGVYSEKPSYVALQTVATLFAGDAKPEKLAFSVSSLPCRFVNGADEDGPELMHCGFRLDDGSKLLAYWKDTDVLTTSYTGTTSLSLVAEGVPELIDLADGTVYEIPASMVEGKNGVVNLSHLPLRDYPLALRFRT